MIRKFAAPLFALLMGILPSFPTAMAAPLPAGFENDFTIEPPGVDLNGRIAFTATIDGHDRVLVLDLDTKRIRPLVDHPGNNMFPSWSPDGTKLAFTSDRDGRKLIYLANFDGSDQRRITKSTDGVEEYPSWSPDGAEILFSRENTVDGESETNVLSINPGTGSARSITNFKQRNVTPRWRPDGLAVTYSTNRFWPGWDVCTFTLKDQKERCPLNGSQSYCRATWSNSGKFLAYTFGQARELDIGIFEDATTTTSPLTLAQDPGKDYDASWSPDDKFLIFARETTEGSEVYNIFISDLKSSPKRLIASKHSLRYPAWTEARTIDLEARRILESEGITPRPRPTSSPTAEPSSSDGASSNGSTDQ